MHSFDFKQIMHASAGLYRLLNLESWAVEVEKSFEIDHEDDDVLDIMQLHHLGNVILMPSYKFQLEHTGELIDKMEEGIHRIGFGTFITDSVQYDPSRKIIESDFNVTSRYDKPYALFYSWDMAEQSTYGLSGTQVKQLFQKNQWTGMTSQEFLVAQSRCIINSDQREKLWTWLVDSSNDVLTSIGFLDQSSIKVYTCKQGSSNIERGALITHIIPLREVKEYKR